MGWTIRKVTPDDLPALCTLLDEIQVLHAQALPHIFRTGDVSSHSLEHLRSVMDNPSVALFVAEEEGQVIGLIEVCVMQTADDPLLVPRRYAKVETIVVSAAHQRKGVGRALMEHAHDWARERGLDEVMLGVWEFNQGAIAFYEELGYTTAFRRMWRRLNRT